MEKGEWGSDEPAIELGKEAKILTTKRTKKEDKSVIGFNDMEVGEVVRSKFAQRIPLRPPALPFGQALKKLDSITRKSIPPFATLLPAPQNCGVKPFIHLI